MAHFFSPDFLFSYSFAAAESILFQLLIMFRDYVTEYVQANPIGIFVLFYK